MGMLDSQVVLAEGQTPTATGDTGSTNTLNTGGANLGDAGQTQENLWANAICTTTATTGSTSTIAAVLQSSPDNSTWRDEVVGKAFNVAGGALPAGTVMLQVQPPPGMQQYWRFAWRIGTAVLTGGAFDAYISNTIQRNVAQPSGFAVS